MNIVKRINVPKNAHIPALLHISYANAQAQVIVSRTLWPAWGCLPPTDMTSSTHTLNPATGAMRRCTTVHSFAISARSMTDQQLAELPDNPDKDTTHTDWRVDVYQMWNHVFFDLANFLKFQFKGNDEVGHFHPPNADACGLVLAKHDTPNKSIRKFWDTDVLVTLAYVQPGLNVILASTYEHGDDFEIWEKYDIYYVRRGVEVIFDIDGELPDDSDLRAVLVYGRLCNEAHDPDDPPGRPEQKAMTEEESKQADLQAEAQSSIQNVFAMAMQDRARREGTT